jgi:ABC-type branched-subunit amino acid transport system substrate-binding protein
VAALAAVAASQITPEDTSTLVTPPDFFVNNTGATTTIKFGCMLPFSGDNVIKGYAARNGIMMAMTDAAKKYPKYSFQLICRDTVCKSDFSPAAAQALKDAKVVAALGDVCSGGSLAAKDTLAPTLLISPSATSNLLTNDTDNFLRVSACKHSAAANSRQVLECRFMHKFSRACSQLAGRSDTSTGVAT